jgi:hypothetical protein
VLEKTPDVYSAGKLCKERGWDWHWKPYADEPIMSKGNVIVYHDVVNNVPHVRERNDTAAPCEEGGATGSCEFPPTIVASDVDLEVVPAAPDEVGDVPQAVPSSRGPLNNSSKPVIVKGHDSDVMRTNRLITEATSAAHMRRHRPANPFCDHCKEAKLVAQRFRRRDPKAIDRATEFGEVIHLDHLVMGNRGTGEDEKAALLAVDGATNFKDFGACEDQTEASSTLRTRS